MKKLALVSVLFFSFIAITCEKDEQEDFRICGTMCPAGTPWTVESLNQGNPCFATYDECRNWAMINGYSDKPCVRCN